MWLMATLACSVPDTDSEPKVAVEEERLEECVTPAITSLCDNPASIVHGTVQLPDGAENTEGNLVIGMMHRRMGDPTEGGHPHWGWGYVDVDLTEPYPFEIDMCAGNAVMWSEENCEYHLIVILDRNTNNGMGGSQFFTPDEGENAAMEVFDLSCHAEGETCMNITLDCVAGAGCIDYEEPETCTCAEDVCPSESGICWL